MVVCTCKKGGRMMVYSWVIMFLGFLIINGIFAYQTKNIPDDFLSTTKYQMYMIPLFFVANMLVGYGFKLGYKYMNNMTLVVSSSKIFDVMALLVISYLIFAEVPTIKTVIGLILVIAGLIIAKL